MYNTSTDPKIRAFMQTAHAERSLAVMNAFGVLLRAFSRHTQA
ncbi:MAG: hypothetical protein AAGF79_15235 [Pseudomonadota bacterium]